MARLAISSITLDKECQPREELDSALIQEYAEAMKGGVTFPPVVTFSENGTHWLADGFHRVYAAKVARLEEIEVRDVPGTKRDAILYSAGANADHGKRRTDADKRRAVMRLLMDGEWQLWASVEIARRCAVSDTLVGKVREEVNRLQPPTVGDCNERVKYMDHWGHVRAMDTSNIVGHAEPEPQSAMLAHNTGPEPSPKTFNRTNENIEWASWTWNPVTGCLHNCPYCYARDIAMRFNGHFKPEFHPDRLDAPHNTKMPVTDKPGDKNVFVCSMADLFGEWVPQEWIDAVIEKVRSAPQWNFLFLTKAPERLLTVEWPDNAWVGATVDKQERVWNTEQAFSRLVATVKFVSCEPLLGPVRFEHPEYFDWIIIGGFSPSTRGVDTHIDPEWTRALWNQAKDAGCMAYFKPNAVVAKEYPR